MVVTDSLALGVQCEYSETPLAVLNYVRDVITKRVGGLIFTFATHDVLSDVV